MNTLKAQVELQVFSFTTFWYFFFFYKILLKIFKDQEINQLQKQLKEAEQILATALFEARQKLSSINRANKRPVQSEELIKFSHRISASHAISAPLTWQQGDLRRPYPTDIEMRLGFLGKSDLNINGHSLQTQNNSNDVHRNSGGKYRSTNRIVEYFLMCFLQMFQLLHKINLLGIHLVSFICQWLLEVLFL